MERVLSYLEAAACVVREADLLPLPREVETVTLLDTPGRVLAEAVLADRDQPPFPRSTRDGFAGRAEDWAAGPVRLAGSLRAGELPSGEPLAPGTCIEIMTGAPTPAGANCIVMVEHAIREGDTIRLAEGRRIAAGTNIVPTGTEARSGEVILATGTRVRSHGIATGIAAAAACGYAQVKVYRRPRVAVLATGDELVDVSEQPAPHQIRNSNTYSLAAQVRALGGEPVWAPPVKDTAASLEMAIRWAREQADLLLLSGGVSMGQYDLVEPALASLGGRFHFTGAKIQPGKPVVFGEMGGMPFFGLPGNPVSTMVCFALFVAPVLAALGGERGYALPVAQARLTVDHPNDRPLTRFLPARLDVEALNATVTPILWQGSGDLAATARANCFLVVPEGSDLRAGDTASVLLA